MTPLGYILSIVGLLCFFISKAWLYRLLVFFSLFSAASVANFGQADSGSAVQVWMLFAALWLLRSVLSRWPWLPFSADVRIRRQCNLLLIFLIVAAISLAMPLYINGALDINYYGDRTPLFLTWHNVTQVLYLLLGVVLAIAVAHANLRREQRRETERTLVLSAGFVAAWGIVQFFCNWFDVPYPAFIFNNSESISAKGYLETMNGVGRISSVTVEPSMLAQGLLSILPLTLPVFLGKRPLFSTPVDRAFASLIVVVLIISTSSTAYIGLIIYGIATLYLLTHTGLLSRSTAWKVIAAGVIVIGISLGLAVSSIPLVSDILNSALLRKFSDSSGLERAVTVASAFGYFQKYPLLGIGWGSAVSHDLVVKLLSNVGILGTISFLGAILYILKRSLRFKPSTDADSLARLVWTLSMLVYLLTSILITFPLAFGNFWITLGMVISVGSAAVSRSVIGSRALSVTDRPAESGSRMPHGSGVPVK